MEAQCGLPLPEVEDRAGRLSVTYHPLEEIRELNVAYHPQEESREQGGSVWLTIG